MTPIVMLPTYFRRRDALLVPRGLPDDFGLTPEGAAVVINQNLDADKIFRKFVYWARTKGIVLADWEMRWVMWCEDQVDGRYGPSAAMLERVEGDDGLPRYGAEAREILTERARRQARRDANADPYGD
jgi:hypothetical protein